MGKDMSRLCTLPGCDRGRHARGLCFLHYQRTLRGVDLDRPLMLQSSPGEASDWIDQHLGHDGDGCLIWPFGRLPDGRARLSRSDYAARVMCERAHGPAPSSDHEAAHSCGKGHLGCVNPKHLRWATKLENERDKIKHGTYLVARMPRKFTSAQINEIRRLGGSMLQREIAERFGTSQQYISEVLSGKKRLPEEILAGLAGGEWPGAA